MKLKYLLLLVLASTSFMSAQDTAPDQTAPQSQPQTTWKDRFNQLKGAATSGLPASGSSTNGCNASELFGMGTCQMLVNGNRDPLSWQRDAGGMERVFYITQKSGGAGTGGDMNYLGEDSNTATYYMQSADGIKSYTVTGTFPAASRSRATTAQFPRASKAAARRPMHHRTRAIRFEQPAHAAVTGLCRRPCLSFHRRTLAGRHHRPARQAREYRGLPYQGQQVVQGGRQQTRACRHR